MLVVSSRLWRRSAKSLGPHSSPTTHERFHSAALRCASRVRRRARGRPVRLGRTPARPRRRHLHRPARPVGRGAGRDPRRRNAFRAAKARVGGPRSRQGAATAERFGEPEDGDWRSRGGQRRPRDPERVAAHAFSNRGSRGAGREEPTRISLSRPATPTHDEDARASQQGEPDHPRLHGRAGVHRGRDTHPHAKLALWRARLSRPVAAASRQLLRAAAGAADAQAAADGLGRPALLPDRALLPR